MEGIISVLDHQFSEVQMLGPEGNYLFIFSMDNWKFRFVFIFISLSWFCVGKHGCLHHGNPWRLPPSLWSLKILHDNFYPSLFLRLLNPQFYSLQSFGIGIFTSLSWFCVGKHGCLHHGNPWRLPPSLWSLKILHDKFLSKFDFLDYWVHNLIVFNPLALAFLLHYLDFVLKGTIAFTMVILEDHLLHWDLWRFYMIVFIQVWFLGLLSPQFYIVFNPLAFLWYFFYQIEIENPPNMATEWIFLLIKISLDPHGANMWFFTLGLKVEKLPSGH